MALYLAAPQDLALRTRFGQTLEPVPTETSPVREMPIEDVKPKPVGESNIFFTLGDPDKLDELVRLNGQEYYKVEGDKTRRDFKIGIFSDLGGIYSEKTRLFNTLRDPGKPASIAGHTNGFLLSPIFGLFGGPVGAAIGAGLGLAAGAIQYIKTVSNNNKTLSTMRQIAAKTGKTPDEVTVDDYIAHRTDRFKARLNNPQVDGINLFSAV